MQNDKTDFKTEFNKRLIKFSVNIINFCDLIRKNRNLWSIADQLIRSATSVGANIREAKASSSKRDYIKFFQIALKSANETAYWLELFLEINFNEKQKAKELLDEANQISKILAAGLITMKGRREF